MHPLLKFNTYQHFLQKGAMYKGLWALGDESGIMWIEIMESEGQSWTDLPIQLIQIQMFFKRANWDPETGNKMPKVTQ